MKTKNFWVTTVTEDEASGELVMTFPPEMLAQVGWNPGDVLVWDCRDADAENGSWSLTKKET